jgi:hypothetical protein
LLRKLGLHKHRLNNKGQLNGNICDFDYAATKSVEELVTHHGMTTEELHRLELELRTIIERIDAIRTKSRNFKHMPELTAEETKGLDRLGNAKGLAQKRVPVLSLDRVKPCCFVVIQSLTTRFSIR